MLSQNDAKYVFKRNKSLFSLNHAIVPFGYKKVDFFECREVLSAGNALNDLMHYRNRNGEKYKKINTTFSLLKVLMHTQHIISLLFPRHNKKIW